VKVLIWVLMIIVVLWSVFPLFWYGIIGFTEFGKIPTSLRLPERFNLDGFRAILGIKSGSGYIRPGAENATPSMIDSIIISFLSIVICLFLTIGASYVFSRFKFRGSKLLFNSLLGARAIPPVSIVISLYVLMSTYGLIDTYIGLALPNAAFTMCTAVWLMKGFFDMVPVDLEEQARIDGASRVVILVRIVAPLAAPGMAVTAGFIFLRTWQEFLMALILTKVAIKPIPIALYGQISSLMIYYNEVSALSLISMIPLVIFFIIVGKHMVRGLTMGALKY